MAIAGMGFGLPGLLQSCAEWYDGKRYSGKVLIIGAGAAGLYAGYLLKERGVDFEILEASDSLGGRLQRSETFADFEIDLGANTLKGNYSVAADLVTVSGTSISPENRSAQYWKGGQFIDEFPFEFIFHYDIMAQEAIAEDLNYSAYFEQYGSKEDNEFFHHFAAAEAGTSPDRVSAKWEPLFRSKATSGAERNIFAKSYSRFIQEHVGKAVEGRIRFNTTVSTIDYSQSLLKVGSTEGSSFQGTKVLVTVPISVLKAGNITFSPSLPDAKMSAFSRIDMDACVHVLLKFSEQFYPDKIIGGSTCTQYLNAAHGKQGQDHVLSALVMGKQASALTELGEEAMVQALLQELNLMYENKASAYFLESQVKNWGTDRNALGAFSFCRTGHGETARLDLAEPIDGKLFFAGEASHYNGHHATVHGAMETAYREVLKILANA